MRTSLFIAVLSIARCASAAEAPTFNKDVAPILYKNCTRCHRTEGIAAYAPFVSYETVRPWAKSIRSKVLLREMPPWPPDPAKSVKFRSDARLQSQEIATLTEWVDAGAPKGKDENALQAPQFAGGWLNPSGRDPDLVISMPQEFQAPATGEIPYGKYLVPVPLTEDKWVMASQARPGNSALVHHMAITEVSLHNEMAPGDVAAIAALGRELGLKKIVIPQRPAVPITSNPGQFDMLGVYTPGTTFESYGDGNAKLLKGGKDLYLNFNVHYQATGKPERDRSMIGFWFGERPKHQLFRVPASYETIIVNGAELLTDAPGRKAEGTKVVMPPIPAGADNFEVVGVTAYAEPVTMYQFHPHAHLRAKDFNYTVVYPDGREESVLDVPKYDFRWQLAYDLETPLRLPAGSKLVVTAHYDNSTKNAHNPAPDKEVYFRDQNQSWDEMFTPFIQYSLDSQDPAANQARQNGLSITEAVGCLQQDSAGAWVLTHSNAAPSQSQPTSSAELNRASAKPLGDSEYHLLGVKAFNPTKAASSKVAVKGVGVDDRLNVTSLQVIAKTCGN